jgi:hypothetical protein
VDGDLNHISEAKGMFNRIVRRDQRDWREVQLILGMPDRRLCNSAAEWLAELRLRAKAGRSLGGHIGAPVAKSVAQALASAKRELSRRISAR